MLQAYEHMKPEGYILSASFFHRIKNLSLEGNRACLQNMLHGIEKESLRVTPTLRLSQQPHPQGLGSALTHPYITTDYSEALLEFVTPVYNNPDDALHMLTELHCETLHKMPNGEFIWNTSMPAVLEGDAHIPVANYGTSNTGYMKHVYRLGLSHRYGKAMQTIAGIHYNVSLPETFWGIIRQADEGIDGYGSALSAQDYQSACYFAMIRNFRRYAWLLSYLFGASPAVDSSFLTGNTRHGLEQLDEDTWYAPWATSLRMSDLGYTSDAQTSLHICYNTLDEYTESLWRAIHTPYPAYEKVGVKDSDGNYLQLNTNLLQIENEYYSIVRPKRVIRSGEKPIMALKERGVEYIEVRCLDINPLLPLGIDGAQSRFLDIFLLYCALQESPDITPLEYQAIAQNFDRSVREGRRPGLELIDGANTRTLVAWGQELCEQLQPVADLLDQEHGTSLYSAALKQEQAKLADVSLTPSAIILAKLQAGESFREFSANCSRQHSAQLKNTSMDANRQAYFDEVAATSLRTQALKERSDTMDFSTFLQDYFSSEERV